jgi:hypothetical protein
LYITAIPHPTLMVCIVDFSRPLMSRLYLPPSSSFIMTLDVQCP